MVLKVLGSSSKGNCYLLEASDGVLVIEAGIPATEVKKALGFDLLKVAGCLVSHRHGDHSRFLKDVLTLGVRVLALEDVFASHGLSGSPFCKPIEPLRGYRLGGFKVFALPVAHDVPCLGFIVDHREMGRLLFVTDTMMLEYTVPQLDHVMLEVNYCDRILQANIDAGIVPASMRDRLMRSHMELLTAKDIVRANDLSRVKELVLLHLSDNNSHAALFREEMEKVSGKPVYVARRGLEVNLWK